MTEDQRKKYEEAARDWSYNILVDQRRLHPQDLRDAYFEGCTFASQDTEERLTALQDENKRLRAQLTFWITPHTCSLEELQELEMEATKEAHKLLNPEG